MRALKVQSAGELNGAPVSATPDNIVIVRTAAAPMDEIVSVLHALVGRFAEIPALADTAAALSRRLDLDLAEGGWALFVRSVAEAVGELVNARESQRRELDDFLEQLTQQLPIELTVKAETVHLQREAVTSANGAQLKSKVKARLEEIARHVIELKRKEAHRHAEDERCASELSKELSKLRGRTDELIKLCAEQEARLMIDSLTGCHSRYAYERRLDEEFQRWQRHSQPLSFSIWDIDLFKRVNDSYGHEAGDHLLRSVAELFAQNKRAEDFLARIGGEEFALLLPMTTLEAATSVAEKLRRVVEAAPFRHHGESVQVTMSAGLTDFRSGDTLTSVYQRADRALYKAKQWGRNRCVAG
jgi:diguanylate cyclase